MRRVDRRQTFSADVRNTVSAGIGQARARGIGEVSSEAVDRTQAGAFSQQHQTEPRPPQRADLVLQGDPPVSGDDQRREHPAALPPQGKQLSQQRENLLHGGEARQAVGDDHRQIAAAARHVGGPRGEPGAASVRQGPAAVWPPAGTRLASPHRSPLRAPPCPTSAAGRPGRPNRRARARRRARGRAPAGSPAGRLSADCRRSVPARCALPSDTGVAARGRAYQIKGRRVAGQPACAGRSRAGGEPPGREWTSVAATPRTPARAAARAVAANSGCRESWWTGSRA